MDDALFAKLTPGRIILAGVTDPQGRNYKVRPVVLLTRPSANDPVSEFRVACGSTVGPVAENEPFTIRLPGHHQRGGHPRTGLRETTWFYAGWLRTATVSGVADFLKLFPEHELIRLRELIASLAEGEAQPPAE